MQVYYVHESCIRVDLRNTLVQGLVPWNLEAMKVGTRENECKVSLVKNWQPSPIMFDGASNRVKGLWA